MSFNIDSKSILVDALKYDLEDFKNSNLILKNERALKALYMVDELKQDLMEFAKNPEVNKAQLPAPPKPPILDNLNQDEQERAKVEYKQLMDMYQQEALALTLQVPLTDLLLIENYLKKFNKTIQATPSVKGKRFFAFTKNVQEDNGGLFGFMHKNSQQQ